MRYVVTRANWRRLTAGVARLPGAEDVATFDTAAEAADDAARREAEVRATVNPFAWGDGLFDVTRLAPHALCDWLQEAGLTPPPPAAPRDEWVAWWELAGPELTADQSARAWEAFDQFRLFGVAERDERPVVHVLTMIPWGGEDDEYSASLSASFEGGEPRAAYRSHEAAARAGRRAAANGVALGNEHDDPYVEYDVGGRVRFAADPLSPAAADEYRRGYDRDAIPWFDVTPVELAVGQADLPYLRRVFAVVRLGWESRTAVGGFREWEQAVDPEAAVGLPVAAHPDRTAAEVDAWGRDVAARRDLNPFRFGHPRALSRLSEAAYRAMLADLGLELPSGTWDEPDPGQQPAWAAWYEHAACLLADEQREMVWDLLDQLRFHQVVELELRG